MSTKCNFQLSPVHPSIGTLIDGGSLQLVEVLGVGGYGVVYRAVEARPSGMTPKSFAVKCLVAPPVQNPRLREVHVREIVLHQLASGHPGVITLHRVVQCQNLTYIIMDYAPDHDLFTQILHSCRYLGDDALIKHVFLQLLDAVEHCHSLGIYHRDLKPENILCYDDGLRIAITDFGLATTEKVSDEFRTGSVFHMSPECQRAAFGSQESYSPMHNDIWSLGIILLNLATGRNPWDSAIADDPVFQAYLRGPMTFLPTVLPISLELNKILVGMLNVDYRRRTPLQDVRRAIQRVTTFYSEGVIFKGTTARYPWVFGIDIDIDSPSPLSETWSRVTASDIVSARQPSYAEESSYDEIPRMNRSSCGATWTDDSAPSSSPSSSSSSGSEPGLVNSDMFGRFRTPPETPVCSPVSPLPATPNSGEIAFGSKAMVPNRKHPTVNTIIPQPRFHDHDANLSTFSEDSAIMQTAIEYDRYPSMFHLPSAISESKFITLPASAITTTAVVEDKEVTSPSHTTPLCTRMVSTFLSQPDPVNNSDAAMEEACQLVSTVLHNKLAYKALLDLEGEKAQEMSEILQKVSDNQEIPIDLRHSALYATVRLCTASGVYPQCLALQDIRYETNPVASGAFGDIWKGHYKNRPVCLKVARVYKGSDVELLIRSYTREAIMWSYFSHPNLLPFYGIYQVSERLGCVGLVSPWMENGNVNEYLQANPRAPRLPLVHDILAGLRYLHMKSVVHGDLKGANILINKAGSACLADFGLSSVEGVFRWTSLETTSRIGGTVRWQAPEIMEGTSGSRPTFSADVYSVASVLYEVFTGQIPFHEIPNEMTVILRVTRGLRPTRPSSGEALELSVKLWETMQQCWSHTPSERPSVDRVAETLPRTPPTELTRGRKKVQELERKRDAEVDTLDALTPLSFRAAMRDQDPNFSKPEINLLRECARRRHISKIQKTYSRVINHRSGPWEVLRQLQEVDL